MGPKPKVPVEVAVPVLVVQEKADGSEDPQVEPASVPIKIESDSSSPPVEEELKHKPAKVFTPPRVPKKTEKPVDLTTTMLFSSDGELRGVTATALPIGMIVKGGFVLNGFMMRNESVKIF